MALLPRHLYSTLDYLGDNPVIINIFATLFKVLPGIFFKKMIIEKVVVLLPPKSVTFEQ